GLFGLKRKPWQHQDPRRRLDGLRAIRNDQQALLASLAQEDPDPGVRHAALARVHDPEQLQKLLDHDDPAVAAGARQRLSGSIVDLIKRLPWERAAKLLDQVEEQSALADISLQAQDAQVRSAACQRLCAFPEPSPALLARVAIQDADGSLAGDCVQRIDKLAQLKEVAKKAKQESVRRQASDRVAAIREELDRPSPEQRRKARRQDLGVLLEEARRLAAHSDLDRAESALQRLQDDWQERLATEPELDIESAAQELIASWERVHLAFAEKRKQVLADLERDRQAQAEREELLAEAERDLAAVAEDERGDLVDRLQERWQACADCAPEQRAALEERWRSLLRPVGTAPAEAVEDGPASEDDGVSGGLSAAEEAELDAILAEAQQVAAGEDLRAADQQLKGLHKRWNAIAGGLDREDPRRNAFNECYVAFKQRRAQAHEEHEQAIEQRLVAMAALQREAEQLADDGLAERDADAGLQALKDLRARWREVGKVPRHRLQEVLQAFNAACERVQVQLRAAHEERDWERFANATRAEELIEAIQALLPGDPEEPIADQDGTFEQVKELQKQWRDLGFFPRDRKEDLWQRYKAAGDAVYERLRPFFAERDREREENFQAKQALLDELRDLVEAEQPHGVAGGLIGDESIEARRTRFDRVQDIQAAWKETGPVPRDRSRDQGLAFKQQLDRFYQGRRIQRQHLEEEHQENLERKQELIADAGLVAERAEHWRDGKLPGLKEEQLLADIKAVQREWRAIGFVPKNEKDAINATFKAACDRVYGVLEPWFRKQDEERAGNLEQKQALLNELEELTKEERPDWFRDEVLEIRQRWAGIGHVPREQAREINGRYRELCDRILGSPTDVSR
ncbi:MAG: DUF349 domain-containing protein, partial [Planctomycetota bacterium]